METNSTAYTKKRRSSNEGLGSFKIIHTECPSGDSSLSTTSNKTLSEYKIVYNETRQTNRHKTPSGVWRYFALATKDTTLSGNPDDPPDDRILCMLCYARGRIHVYKSKTSSSNLWKHLNRKHNIEIPCEKMFTISSVNFDGFDFNGDPDDHSHGANSTDDQFSALDVDDNDEIVIKSDDYEETDGFQEEHIIATTMDDDKKHQDTIVKFEPCSTDAIFKDIGLAIIEEVAKRPNLYETQNVKSNSMRATKEMQWDEVYHALGEIIEVDRIQKIWKNIRERYRKIRLAEKDGLDGSSQKYKYYNQLRFLDPSIAMEQSSDTSLDEPPEKKARTDDFFLFDQNDVILSSVDDMDRSEQNYISEEIIHDNCTVSSSNPPITTSAYPQEISQTSSEESPPKQSSSPQAPANNWEQIDEFELFGKLIAKKLRSVPKDRVNLIELKIMQAIIENS